MDSTSSPPEHPDSVYESQASYLAEHTKLTEREAEAYLRRRHTVDDDLAEDYVSDRELATKMGISPSGFSQHLNTARSKLEGEGNTMDSLVSLLLTTEFGGANGHSRHAIGSTTTRNAHVVVTEDDFSVSEGLASKYKVHLVYEEHNFDFEYDDLPKNIIRPTKYSLFTVEADSKAHLLSSTVAYVDALDALDHYDVLQTADLLEDALSVHVDHLDDDGASAIVQDASALIMDDLGQH